jgi:phage shock protein PspC (stress-responsive transcriptional regulator)
VALILSIFLILLCLVASLIPVILAYVLAAICFSTCKPSKLKEKVMLSNFWRELTHF